MTIMTSLWSTLELIFSKAPNPESSHGDVLSYIVLSSPAQQHVYSNLVIELRKTSFLWSKESCLLKMFNCEDLFLDRARKVMKYMGVWLPPLNESAICKFYRYFMVFLQYLFLFFQLIYIGQVWGDLEAIFQACYLLFTQACLCFKVTVFLVNDDLLRILLEQMNSDIFQPQSPEHERILAKQAVRIKRFLFSFMISSQTTCGLWALKPLFDDAGRNFPFDMWMPVTPETSPSYELGYAFQLVTICISAYMYFGVDSVALSTIIFGCAQIKIVQDKILSVASVDYAKTKPEERKEILALNHKILVECINHHQAIVTFTQMVEDAYHSYLLFQLTGSIGIFCMSALRLLVVSWQSMQFFSMISYLFVMSCQLFVCCWCGNQLTATSEELHTVMYKCMWYEQDVRFKRDLCFALMRMGRPMVLRAGHYVPLSWTTYIAVLRTSYSYFAVLNQAHK